MTPPKTSLSNNSTEDAWRIVAERAATSPVPAKIWCFPPEPELRSAPVEPSRTVESPLLPLKKRRRVILVDTSDSLEPDDIPALIPSETTLSSHSPPPEPESLPRLKFPHLQSQNYNQNGHVGIYSPQQRAAILKRFHEKRLARKWRKKIRYDCRKNLADKRVRVKGRFVKGSCSGGLEEDMLEEAGHDQEVVSDGAVRGNSDSLRSVPQGVESHSMPDTTDVEAGFDPNEESPFRRTRRVTVP